MNTRCPECRTGKHQNCDGLADMDDNGKLYPCLCEKGDHPLRQSVVDQEGFEYRIIKDLPR